MMGEMVEKQISEKEEIDLMAKKIYELHKEVQKLTAFNKKLIEIISTSAKDKQ